MPISEDKKFSFDDFASFEAINRWWDDLYNDDPNMKDKEGYTPLGAAILNSVPPECVAYIMQLYTFNNTDPLKLKSFNNKDNPFIDVSADKSKGKSPLEVACIAMNSNAAKVIIANYYEYQLKDESNNPIPKLTHYGDPLVDTDSSGEVTKEYFMYSSVPLWADRYAAEKYKYTKQETYGPIPTELWYKNCEVENSDILAASILSKPDILKLCITSKRDLSFQDSNGNTPILLACLANCYESVDHLLDYDKDAKASIMKPNSDDVNALSVAIQTGDDTLVNKLLGKFEYTEILMIAFSNSWYGIVDFILIKLITGDQIYIVLDTEYDTSDGTHISIAQYINDSNKDALYELLLPKYGEDKFNNYFKNSEYFNIIAFLYKKDQYPFNNSDKLVTLLGYNNLYAGTIIVLFNNGVIALDDICDIEDDELRNKAVDVIFTMPYNKKLMIALIKSSSENRDSVITHLYDTNYFSLQDIANLRGAIQDEILFDIVINLTGSSLIEIDTNITDTRFKRDLIVYMFSKDYLTLSEIDSASISSTSLKYSVIVELYLESLIDINDLLSDELTSETKCNVINSLYKGSDLDIEDIYVIYENYNDSLSSLNDDLKPFIGSMKYCNEDVISSDFFWAYNFKSRSALNWRHPQGEQSVYPPVADTSLQPVNSDRYSTVVITDSNKNLIYPSKFRLYRYDDKPEFYVDHNIETFGDINGIIVSFNKSLVSDQFELPGSLYTITDGVISWYTGNILYPSLSGERCYIGCKAADQHSPIILIQDQIIEAYIGETVTLNASDSYDPDGDAISFIWDGEYASLLTEAGVGKKKFTVPSGLYGDTAFTVIASDGNTTSTAVITVIVKNRKPVAIVDSLPVRVNPGSQIQLNASNSSDPDNDELSFTWSGNGAEFLNNIHFVKPTLTIPSEFSGDTRKLNFTVTVIDSHGESDSATVTTIVNQKPIILLTQSEYSAEPGDTIQLDASKSVDPDRDALSFKWEGYTSGLNSTVSSKPIFTVPATATSGTHYILRVTVTDSYGASSSKQVTITVAQNKNPVVVISDTFEGKPGDIITLDASDSYDPDEDYPLFYMWSGSHADQLDSKTSSSPKFTIPLNADNGDEYLFTVKVTDSHGAFSYNETVIRATIDPIGKFAFETGVFTVEFVNDNDKILQFTADKDTDPQTYSMTDLKVKEQWSLVYNEGYTVEQVPKSPHWTDTNKVFYYDPLYDDVKED